MTHQPSFSQAEFATKKKTPRREKFLTRMVVTAANVADITQTAELLHGEEKQVHADDGVDGPGHDVHDRTVAPPRGRKQPCLFGTGPIGFV